MDDQILQWNIRGFRKNFDFLHILIQEHLPFAIALQETRLSMAKSKKHTGDNDLLRGYTPYLTNNDDNEDSTQHGVGILIRNHFISSLLKINFNITSCQIIAVQVTLQDRCLTICSLYRKSSEFFSKNDLENIISKLPKPYMILGDFNAHSTLWGDDNTCAEGRKVEDFLNVNDEIAMFNTKAKTFLSSTHHTYSSIDLSLCSADTLLDYYWSVLDDLYGSDHFPIVLKGVNKDNHVDLVPQYNIKKANWSKFRDLCSQEFEPDLAQDPDHINILTDGIRKIMDQSIPLSNPNGKRPKPWFNKDVQEACKKSKAAHRRFRNNPTDQNYQHKKIMRAKARRVIKQSKRKSWRSYVGNLNRYTKLKKVWEMVRKISGKYNQQGYKHLINEQGQKVTSKTEIIKNIAEGFAQSSSSDNYSDEIKNIKNSEEQHELDFKSNNKEIYNKPFKLRDLKRSIKRARNTASGPDNIHIQVIKHLPEETLIILLDIINDIWVRGDFPNIWREAHIIPLPKPNKDLSNKINYRPIALTSQLCKIMEQMVNERLIFYLNKNGYLSNLQCGFRKNRNCLDHLIRLETYIREAFGRGEQTIAVFFDLEKAYDTT